MRKIEQQWIGFTVLTVAIMLLFTACRSGEELVPPTEEEQIKNVALGYFVRDTSIPEYEAEIEAIVDDWARVSLTLVATESTTDPMTLYLQNQAATDDPVPTAVPMTLPGNNARTTNDFGWAVITEPQVYFSDEELDSRQVPEKIRP